jgi:hypothetical protein
MTTMLASIIDAALSGAPEIEVAGRACPGEDLVALIRQAQVDVLIMRSSDPGSAEDLLPLLRDRPALLVLAIDGRCRNGFMQATANQTRGPFRNCRTRSPIWATNLQRSGLVKNRGRDYQCTVVSIQYLGERRLGFFVVAQTTILLSDLPQMLEDIVFHLLRDRTDLRILRGSAPDGLQAPAAGAQLVIVARPDPESFAGLDAGLGQAAALALLALNADGSWGCLHILQPKAARFDDISAAPLTTALSAAESAGRA